MLKNYLKIALRNFLRHKGYSFVNVAGLAVGMACCIVMLLFVQDELRYDRWHVNAKRIFRLASAERSETGERMLANSYAPVAPALRAAFSEIEQTVRLMPRSVAVKRDALKQFQEERFYFADSTFFALFSFEFLQGDGQTALQSPEGLVLTQAAAQKYFGTENPLGQILTIENRLALKVTGVLQNLPRQSHLQFDFVANLKQVETILGAPILSSRQGWYWPPMYTYLLLPSPAAATALAPRLPEFVRARFPHDLKEKRALHLQPMTDIHLYSELENEIAPTSKIAYVYIFSAAAGLILLLACINFMNLATARSAQRAKEVGLRKVVGAERLQLVKQFWGESLFYAVLALLLALVLVEVFLPVFNTLANKQLDLRLGHDWQLALGLLGLTVLVGFIAGSYPAMFLARFRPIQVLQGKNVLPISQRAPVRLRAVLVVAQFLVAIALMIATLVINEQLQFMQGNRLGFNKEHLLVIPVRDENVQQNFEAVKNSLAALPGVVSITALSNFPWQQGFYDFTLKAEGMAPETNWNAPTLLGDHDFISTFGMEIVEGRAFSKAFGADAEEAFILNEAAVKKLGWSSALGKKIEMDGVAAGQPRTGRVIGVVRDFHLRSLHYAMEPLVLLVAPQAYYLDNLVVRVAPQQVSTALAALEIKWRELAPNRPFDYFFLDQAFEQLYRREEKLAAIFKYFSGLTIFVGCLGLFGLASFTATQRTKEIGIRKVLGASATHLAALLAQDFARLVALAFIVAAPLAYYFMQAWLQTFAYRIALDWRTFAFAGAAALALALLTVSYQALKAAFMNPVDALRRE